MNTPPLTRSLVLLAGLGLAGCAAVGPDYVPPATDLPAGWTRLDPAAQPVTHADATGDLSQWWQSLNDPLLSGLIAEALQASPDLRSAQAKLREARATPRGGRRRALSQRDRVGQRQPQPVERGSRQRRRAQFLQRGLRRELGARRVRRRAPRRRGGRGRPRIDRGEPGRHPGFAGGGSGAELRRSARPAGPARHRPRQSRQPVAKRCSSPTGARRPGWPAARTSSRRAATANRPGRRFPASNPASPQAEHRLDILLGQCAGHAACAPGRDRRPAGRAGRRSPSASRPTPCASAPTCAPPSASWRRKPPASAWPRRRAIPSFTLSGSIGLEALTLGALGSSDAATSLAARRHHRPHLRCAGACAPRSRSRTRCASRRW